MIEYSKKFSFNRVRTNLLRNIITLALIVLILWLI